MRTDKTEPIPYAYLADEGQVGLPERDVQFGMFSPAGTEALARILEMACDRTPSSEIKAAIKEACKAGHGEMFDTACREYIADALPYGSVERALLFEAFDMDEYGDAPGTPETIEEARAYIARAYVEKSHEAKMAEFAEERLDHLVEATASDVAKVLRSLDLADASDDALSDAISEVTSRLADSVWKILRED